MNATIELFFLASALSATTHALPNPSAHAPGLSAHASAVVQGAALRRPNIVFIRTDDEAVMDMHVRRPDGSFVMQNVIDLIAKQGVTFSNSFVSYASCSPSRATFLTGRYAHHHHVLGNGPPDGGYAALDHTKTLAVWEARNGYYNCHVGKYLNTYTGAIPPGWDEWYTWFTSQYFNYLVNENGTLVHYGFGPGDYVTEVQTQKAVSFLTRRDYGDRPFLLVVDFTAPHGSDPPAPGTGIYAVPAPWYQGLFDAYLPIWPPNFDERDVSDKPPFVQALPLLSRPAIGGVIHGERTVAETLISVDDGVGRIIAALDATGQLANTFIFFTSDNGMERGEHRLSGGKDRMYEESVRVPLVVRGPGIRPNVVIDSVVANIDYAPTIVELTGATPTLPMDGVSLVPVMSGQAWLGRDGILLESYDGSNQEPVGIRTRDYSYGEYADGFIELYALDTDPYELHNLAYSPAYVQTIAQLHAQVQFLRYH
jgi:arylsulfatase A-like enzyme